MDEEQRLRAAVECFRSRRDRSEHPKGEFVGERGNRAWNIDPAERRPCCASAKASDLGGRQKFVGHWLNKHCRTVEHIALLHGVSVDALRAALKAKPASAGQLKLF